MPPAINGFKPITAVVQNTEPPAPAPSGGLLQAAQNPRKRGAETEPEDKNRAKRSRGNFELIQKRSHSMSSDGAPVFPNKNAEPLQQDSSLATIADDIGTRRAEENIPKRRHSVHSMASMPDNVFDRLGERIQEQTLDRLAKVVEQRITFKKGEGPVGALAKLLGLTKRLEMPTHLAMVLNLAFTDPEMLKIAKMGIRVALSNAKTGGVPPEGFKPLYDLLKKWGYNRQGQLTDPKKFDERLKYMEQRQGKMDELKQFSSEIAPRLGPKPAHMLAAELKAEGEREKSILSLLAEYFMPPAKPKDPAPE